MNARYLISAFLIWACAATGLALDMPETQFNYDVQYKWGIVNIAIGRGVATVSIDNDLLHGTLDGKSIPWEGRVFSIGDVLKASMSPKSQHNQYINGTYRKPKVGTVSNPDNPSSYRNLLGEGELNASAETMEAVSVTANMLGLFYFAKTIDFETLNPGDELEIDVINPDGHNATEQMLIRYEGRGNSKSGAPEEVYEIVFNYSYGGQYTRYPVKCEISTQNLVPVYFGADLKIGHVDMFLAQ